MERYDMKCSRLFSRCSGIPPSKNSTGVGRATSLSLLSTAVGYSKRSSFQDESFGKISVTLMNPRKFRK